eukprot:750866-Amphidinium_carterae.1
MVVETLENFDPLQGRTLEELKDLEDDAEEDVLARYRKQRLAELKQHQSAAKFGHVARVDKQNFVREVTDASAGGQWVLVLLYTEASSACARISSPWEEAAKRFPSVKFLRGIADHVVPGYPDAKTPTVLFYCNSDCAKQVIGLESWGGSQLNADCIEWMLFKSGVLKSTDLEEDPREQPAARSWRLQRSTSHESDDEETAESNDDRCYSSNSIRPFFRS